MPAVAFHFNAPDRLGYACRLLRKAYLRGARLLVLADAPQAAALDLQLWTMAGTGFVPHCLATSAGHVRSRSPIVITTNDDPPSDAATVLVNLRHQMPKEFLAFDRVIEVVTADPQDRAHARERWKSYKAAGLDPQHLDLLQAPGHN